LQDTGCIYRKPRESQEDERKKRPKMKRHHQTIPPIGKKDILEGYQNLHTKKKRQKMRGENN
jgi:hypothetical protein